MPITHKQIADILKDFHYILDHQTWSHKIYKHKDGSIETVPNHKELAIGTARNILKSIAFKQDIAFDSIKQTYKLKF